MIADLPPPPVTVAPRSADGTSVGLRGGRWSYVGDRVVFFSLAGTRFVPGVEVTGRVRRGYRAAGKVRADVQARGPGGVTAELVIRWAGREQSAVAMLTGEVGGRTLRATMPAPQVGLESMPEGRTDG
jgi:hypothetical protein